MTQVARAAALLTLALFLLACDGPNQPRLDQPQPIHAAAPSNPPDQHTSAWTGPAVDLVAPPGDPRPLELDPPLTFEPCHQLFEPASTLVDRFPAHEPAQRAALLAGCAPEAYIRLLDTTLLSYRVAGGPHLRLLSFDDAGSLRWSHLIDRSAYRQHLRARFRGGFIAPLLPHLVCAGTLWNSATQLTCVAADTGEPAFDGALKFWAGIAPRAHGSSLVTAIPTGLSRRYPYSGIEMRYQPFAAEGGRSSFFAADDRLAFFSPSAGASPALFAYDLEDFSKAWTLELPAHPTAPRDQASFASESILLLHIDDRIHVVDTRAGRPLWSAKVGDNPPTATLRSGILYLLIRRDTEPNLLAALSPTRGQLRWWTELPPGTLDLLHYDDTLFTRSVRTIRRVPLP